MQYVHPVFRLDGDDALRDNLGLVHGQIPRERHHQRSEETPHLGLYELLADTANESLLLCP